MKVGRNARAFLGNAAGKRRMRTAWGSVHDIMCPGPLCLRENHVMCPWAWRNWLSVGSTSSRFAAPPILPPHLWYNVPRASMFEDKRCDVSLGLEPSLRAGSLYVCGIIKVGRNATAFLGNAADKRRVRTAWGSIHGILCPGPLCIGTNHPQAFLSGEAWAYERTLSTILPLNDQ